LEDALNNSLDAHSGFISTMVKLGRLPLTVGTEFYYFAETPDAFGPEYQLRVFFSSPFPSPRRRGAGPRPG